MNVGENKYYEKKREHGSRQVSVDISTGVVYVLENAEMSSFRYCHRTPLYFMDDVIVGFVNFAASSTNQKKCIPT
jgi:hypothetical protein